MTQHAKKRPCRARWTTTQPTAEQLLQHFDNYIWKQITNYSRKLGLKADTTTTMGEQEDMRQDIILKVLSLPPRRWRNPGYVMGTIKNAATDSMEKLRGSVSRENGSNRGKSVSQRTDFIEEHNPDSNDDNQQDHTRTLIADAIACRPDNDQSIAIERVRQRLKGRELEVFEWVLTEREDHKCTGLFSFCKKKWRMKVEDVNKLRQVIVDAMHSEGLALNYPSPVKTSDPSRMTPTQRSRWLDGLRAEGHKTLAAAAKSRNVFPYVLNYHCHRIHGCNFLEWSNQ